MAYKLYVGNLPWSVDDAALAKMFGEVNGPEAVETAVVISAEGRSKGFGFVEMKTPEDGAAAIKMYNNKEIEGRTLVVNEARPREERSPGGYRGGNSGGGYRGGNR
jgi:cold-inducible RNA-binding protein